MSRLPEGLEVFPLTQPKPKKMRMCTAYRRAAKKLKLNRPRHISLKSFMASEMTQGSETASQWFDNKSMVK